MSDLDLDLDLIQDLEHKRLQVLADYFQPLIPFGFVLKVDPKNYNKTIDLYRRGGRSAFTVNGNLEIKIESTSFDESKFIEVMHLLTKCMKYQSELIKNSVTFESTKKEIKGN